MEELSDDMLKNWHEQKRCSLCGSIDVKEGIGSSLSKETIYYCNKKQCYEYAEKILKKT